MKRHWMVAAALCVVSLSLSAEPLPAGLAGSWRVTRVLSSGDQACWSSAQAQALVGSTLSYRSSAIRWRGSDVAVEGILTRTVTAAQFRKDNATFGAAPEFVKLGIHSARVTEVDLQHEDMDITGATTEVPGDSVLMVAPNRIVISACGVFFEATKSAAMPLRASR